MGYFWVWLGVAALFAIIEFFTITFFGLWMALAALFPAVIAYLFPTLTIATQLFIWIVASLICAFIWVKWVRSKPEPYLESVLSGQEGFLAEAIIPEQIGVLLLSKPIQGKQEWPCRSQVVLSRQTRVRIISLGNDGVVEVEPSHPISEEE